MSAEDESRYPHMPPPLARTYGDLWRQVVLLHRALLTFRDLYASDEATVELLNRTASGFFLVIQEALLTELILGISRLTDAEANRVQENLSLPRLLSDIDQTTHPTLHADVSELIKEAQEASLTARKHRHKRLAHTDLQVNRGDATLDRLTYGDLEEAIAAIRTVMDAVEHHFEDSTTAFEAYSELGTAKYLLARLRKADDFDSVRRIVCGW